MAALVEPFGDISGTTVSVYTSIVQPEDQPHIDSWVEFEECTGVDVTYEGSKEFEAQIVVRAQSGNPPDIAYIPQPGLLQTLVEQTGTVLPAPPEVEAQFDEWFDESWKAYGTVDDVFYAAPLGANVKSFVWYSPGAFADAGYEIPETWDELIALTDQMIEDNPELQPWCAGIGSGDATGWPATDWMEDLMLRLHGRDVYDQWISHEIPFNGPEVSEALEYVGQILKDPDYVNGGFGNIQTIASTQFQDAGLPILDGECMLHRQASFYQANWPEGTTVAEDGDVYAFYFPVVDAEASGGNPVLGGGEFVAAFSDRPEVQAFQTFQASDLWANAKAEVSGPGWLSANKGLDVSLLASPIDQDSAELLADEESVFGFDASDLMPGEVGSGSFWTEMVNWIANDKPNQDVLDAIEASWPSS